MDRFKELSPDQQKFIDELKIVSTETIHFWHNLFLPLAHFDRKGDFLRSTGCFFKTFVGLIIFFGAVYVVLSLIQGEEATYFIIPVVAIVTAILFLVGTKQYYKQFENRDIPNPLRSFFVPFLELLEQQSAGQSMMELAIDLNPMNDLIGTKPVHKTTDRFNYLSLSVDLPDSGKLALKVSAHGIKYPDHYKLTHAVVLSITYDSKIYELSSSEGPFNVIEEGNKIMLQAKYEEHSRSIIEHDPGPSYPKFVDIFNTMQEAIETKV